MIDLGHGSPLVVIPGVQGRWEWMRPAILALARRCRTITFSSCGEPGAGHAIDRALGFDSLIAQVDAALDGAGLRKAAICGVSYGGLVAVRYAALRTHRVSALVLVSALPPAWRPDARIQRYLRAPRLMLPMFCLGSPLRLWPEIAAAHSTWRDRVAFSLTHLARVAAAWLSPTRMAERVALSQSIDFVRDCQRVAAPTLVMTGEPHLDRVVPVDGTRQYLELIEDARAVTLEDTGHIGLVTKPERFARIVADFIGALPQEARRRA